MSIYNYQKYKQISNKRRDMDIKLENEIKLKER